MNKDEIIERLEAEIENLEGIKFHFNTRLDDAISTVKNIRFELKYPDSVEKD